MVKIAQLRWLFGTRCSHIPLNPLSCAVFMIWNGLKGLIAEIYSVFLSVRMNSNKHSLWINPSLLLQVIKNVISLLGRELRLSTLLMAIIWFTMAFR